MLATRQKINTINTVIRELLQEGVYPTLLDVFDRLGKVRRNPWGMPQTLVRPAYPNQVIGGDDGRDIERTYTDIREDLLTWYNELVDSADVTLATYWMFEARREILKRRVLHVIQAAESQITSSARGGATVLGDTFNAASLVDFTKTTAELNLDGGYVTLPTSLNSLVSVPLSGAEITGETYPNSKPHGSITDALTDAGNTGWYASLDDGTYSVTLKFPTGTSGSGANGIYINPMGPLDVTVSYSNDLYNFYPIVSERVMQERSWTFKPAEILAIRIEVTGGNVGIKQFKLLSMGFDEKARLESVPLQAIDLFGSSMPIHSVRLETDEICPPKTEIKYYVQPIYPIASSASAWYRMTDGPVYFAPTSPVIHPALSSMFRGEEQDREDNQFFTCTLDADPIVETSRLTRGGDPTGGNLGQFYVEYSKYSWKAELDPNHSPTPSDWSGFGAVTQTYWRPLSLSTGYTTQPDPLQQEPAKLQVYGCPMVEATTVAGGSDSSRDWLVIGVKDSDWLMAPEGNYRLSTYIYMTEDLVVSDKPCLLYNPMAKGGSGVPVIAPFRVYLNGELVADVRRAWSGELEGADLSQFNATYAYKAGWNKLEVLIYVKDSMDDLALDEALADGGIGIYIAGNPYNLARLVAGRRVQAQCLDDNRVSEFTLRHIVKPGDNTAWAWTDTAPKRGILLNYDPVADSSIRFDGYNFTQSPALRLTYYPIHANSPIALKFAAEFTREPDASGLPKLNYYKLIVNQAGG